MATNESDKNSRRVNSCDEFAQCTLLSDNPAVRYGRRDLTADHIG